jgi:hypothetical protein
VFDYAKEHWRHFAVTNTRDEIKAACPDDPLGAYYAMVRADELVISESLLHELRLHELRCACSMCGRRLHIPHTFPLVLTTTLLSIRR